MRIASLLFLATTSLALAAPGLVKDPSTSPQLSSLEGQSGVFAERFRILADLDGDGDQDLLLSGATEQFGNSGGTWTVFLKQEGGYQNMGEFFAHPRAISLEPDQDRILAKKSERFIARIWVYLRGSGRSGMLGYYRIGTEALEEFRKLEIYPGDGGTELGNAIYDATFRKSPIPMKRESSKTTKKGLVSWHLQE